MSNNLFEYTGNPFVDAGISALMVWCGKEHPRELTEIDVKNALPKIATLFSQEAWIKTFYTTFPNGVIVQPSNKGKVRENWMEFMTELAKDFKPLGEQGSCIACGRRDAIRIKKEKRGLLRSEVPMTGGSLNYYSFAKSGADYCGVCATAIQVSPIVLYKTGSKMILVHSSSEKAMRSWARKVVQNVRSQLLLGNYTGCFSEDYTNPQNALFQVAKSLIQDVENWANEPVAIRIYHFTNYNQGAELDYYDLPPKIFHFLLEVQQSTERQNWENLIRFNYYFRKGKEEVKIDPNKTEFEEYKNNKNHIYECLLKNEWMLRYLYSSKQKKTYITWELLKLYLTEVREMDKERIEVIKRVADEIATVIRSDESKNPKRLGQLERANTYTAFRNTLRLIIKERIKSGAENPLFSLEEYVEKLFPEGALSWRETQDLILFRLYEVLHTWLLDKGLEISEEEEKRSELETEK